MKKRRVIKVGNVPIGGDNPIVIQSMTDTKTENVENTVKQINKLEEEGCELVRVAVPNIKAAKALKKIITAVNIPLIADIHFDYKLAIMSIEAGVDGLRINPGNIKKKSYVKKIVTKAKKNNIPIRIGVNSGSINRDKYKKPTVKALVDSAIEHIKILEEMNFYDIKVSLKSYDVIKTINAYKNFNKLRNYPLHVGITEAGDLFEGSIRSSIGIGILIFKDLCDTFRVSLTEDPIEEIKVAKQILTSLNKRQFGIDIISCPTCGRTEIDIKSMVKEVKKRVENIDANLQIAIMGCAVNGPGEAAGADLGIAGGKKEGLIFEKGEIVGKYPESVLIDEFIKRVKEYGS